MIGDNWSSDIEGGVNYGLDTCWYNPSRQPRPNASRLSARLPLLRKLTDWLL